MWLPGLNASGSWSHAESWSGVLRSRPAASVSRLARCVRFGADSAARRGARYGVAVRTRHPCEILVPALLCGTVGRSGRGLLGGGPGGKCSRIVGDDADAHPRVLLTAELRTRAKISSGMVRGEPYLGMPSGNQIDFASQLRDPEVVYHIGRLEPELHVLARGNMDLIRRDEPSFG